MSDTTRREFLAIAGGAAGFLYSRHAWAEPRTPADLPYQMVARVDRRRILAAANKYLSAQPITVTANHSPRSAGGLHDYFSQGDYWWPDRNILAAHTSSTTACRTRKTSTRIARRWSVSV